MPLRFTHRPSPQVLLPCLTAAALASLQLMCGGRSPGPPAQAQPEGKAPLTPPDPPPGDPSILVVKPYLQLGGDPVRPDQLVLAWQADEGHNDWVVEVRTAPSGPWVAMAPPVSAPVAIPTMGLPPHRVWSAVLKPLVPGGTFDYRVLHQGLQVFQQAGAKALKGPDQTVTVAVVGDLVDGHAGGLDIARQIHAQNPDMMVAVGDLVYDVGTAWEYRNRFFPVYNADPGRAGQGVPFMRQTPLVGVPGNHDVDHVGRTRVPDRNSLAYFYYWFQPLNGPDAGPNVPNLTPAGDWAAFHAAAGSRFPRMGTFSFDAGPVHWTVLDSNEYMHWTDPALRAWLAKDLAAATAPWRFVAFHHPAVFLHRTLHMGERITRRMRSLWPLLQAGHVDLVFTGHVHTYQRSRPFAFNVPPGADPYRYCEKDGNMVVDTAFDGTSAHAGAAGPIHILSGGGGGHLYRLAMPAPPKPFFGFSMDNQHSFSLLVVDPHQVRFRQIDEGGAVRDSFVLTHR